jgi:hypothetical protein
MFGPTLEDAEDCMGDAAPGQTVEDIHREQLQHTKEEIREYFYGVPDGYVVDEGSQTVTVYEVEVSGRLTDLKLRAYAEAGDWLYSEMWSFRLVIVDASGRGVLWDWETTLETIREEWREAHPLSEEDKAWVRAHFAPRQARVN